MPILQFTYSNNTVNLSKGRMEDITNDTRTSLIDKDSFYQKQYQIDENIYIALNDLFFKLSKLFNKNKPEINAMLIRDNDKNIIIVPSRSYIFWNGCSVDPAPYKVLNVVDKICSLNQTITNKA